MNSQPPCLRCNLLCNIAGVKLSFNIPLFCRLSSLPYNKSCPECVDPLPAAISIATVCLSNSAPRSRIWMITSGRYHFIHFLLRFAIPYVLRVNLEFSTHGSTAFVLSKMMSRIGTQNAGLCRARMRIVFLPYPRYEPKTVMMGFFTSVSTL
jgi:hypothetical protein